MKANKDQTNKNGTPAKSTVVNEGEQDIKLSSFVKGAIARMESTPLLTAEQWHALDDYDGPEVSGDPSIGADDPDKEDSESND